MFTDTHCHIYKEYYEDMDAILDMVLKAGINRVISNGCDDASNKEVLESIKKYDMMYGAIGIHPESASTYKDSDLDYVREHINDAKVVAVGEIGLDYYWTKENKEEQLTLFNKQLALAEEFNKPVVIHSREATLDTIECLKKYKVKGVIHSFSGSYETACIYIKMGFLLGVNGVITFKNCKYRDVIERIPLENLILETDSPYLTPEPFRGKQNNPSHIMDIAKYVAELKGVSLEELAKVTNDNIKRCFDI